MKTNTTHQFKSAFTLVELLVVITIVIVLAGLLLSLTRNMQNKASSATSVSNLHQIGTAIVTYASDHNSTLPGPALSDHFPRYQNNAASGQLGWLLKEYLTTEAQPDNPQPRMFYTPGLDYSAAKSNAKNQKSDAKPTYVLYSQPADADTGIKFWPLGNYNKNSSGNTIPPMTTTQLSARETRGIPWITEIDQIIRPSASRYKTSEEPPHGKFRNTLMFDYSVKAISLGEFKPKTL